MSSGLFFRIVETIAPVSPGRHGIQRPFSWRITSPVASSTLIKRTGCILEVRGEIGRNPQAPTLPSVFTKYSKLILGYLHFVDVKKSAKFFKLKSAGNF